MMKRRMTKNRLARRYRRRSSDREHLGRRNILRFNPYPKTVAGTRGGIAVASVVMVLFALVLIGNLFSIQVLSHDKYSQEAAFLHYNWKPAYPERGAIYDSTGLPLAVTVFDYTVGITPQAVRSWKPKDAPPRVEIAREIARQLSIPQAEMDRYMAQDEPYIQLKKNVPMDAANKLREYLNANEVAGVVLDAVMRREYPQKTAGAQMVGFVNKLEQNITGVLGVELSYDDQLRGKPGYRYSQIDNYSGMQLPFTNSTDQAPVDGSNLKLHLNVALQRYCQSVVQLYVDAYQANSGEIIVMDPKTGAIMAMAGTWNFDLNDPYAVPEGKDPKTWDPFDKQADMDYLTETVWRNQTTSMLYEPGSTYKSFTTAMAMEEKIFEEEELFSDDPITVQDREISCWSLYGHGMESVRMALVRSCNPVMVQLGQRLGMKTFYDYVRALGHQEKTGVDLPAESDTYLHPDPMEIDLANLTFGESSVITPLHLLNAFCVFGNGGVLMRPQIGDKFLDKDGNVIQDIKPEVVRRVFSEETAARMLDYLRDVVTDSEGAPLAETRGYGSAGKTSTSNWGEDDENAVISFASLTPYYDPKVAVLCVLHEPVKGTTSKATAMMSARVSERAMEALGIPRDKSMSNDMYSIFIQRYVPNLKGEAFKGLSRLTFSNNILLDKEPNAPKGATVKYQYPPNGELINSRGTIYVSYSGKPMTETTIVPNFTNLGFEAAYKLAEEMGVNIMIQGSYDGKVNSQSIEAGKSVLKYSIVNVWLD